MTEKIIALMQAGKWEDAIFSCESMLQVQPTNGRIHACLGESNLQLGKLDAAEIAFMRAYTLDPSLWRAAVRRAQCLDKLHRYRECMDVVTEWLRIKPGNTDLLGLKEFLETQHESQEHDGWERTRRLGVTVLNAGFQREDMPSVPSQQDQLEVETDATEDSAPAWSSQMKLQGNPGLG
jgi:tetratricopeptide (TPR) repeat protein